MQVPKSIFVPFLTETESIDNDRPFFNTDEHWVSEISGEYFPYNESISAVLDDSFDYTGGDVDLLLLTAKTGSNIDIDLFSLNVTPATNLFDFNIECEDEEEGWYRLYYQRLPGSGTWQGTVTLKYGGANIYTVEFPEVNAE